MKMQSNFPAQFSNQENDNLNQFVKEALASNVDICVSKNSFTAADLWNIQRMRRSRVIRKYMM